MRTPFLIALALCLNLATHPAFAHHILGIPHYAYDEDYPQTPVLTYRVQAGPHEVKMTGYPGNPVPGERSSLHVYVTRLDTGEPFEDGVTLSVLKDRMIGEDPVVYGPIDAPLEEAMYKFYPRYDEEANYLVRIFFEAEGEPWTIDIPIVVGEPGSPWTVVGGVAGGLLFFVIVIRAIRIKMRRKEKARAAYTPAQLDSAASAEGANS